MAAFHQILPFLQEGNLNGLLNKYMDEEVRVPRKGQVKSRKIILETIDAILNKVTEFDERFDFDQVKTGSDYQRVAIKEGSDLDIALVLKREPVRVFCPSLFCPSDYTAVRLSNIGSILKWHDLRVDDEEGSFLSSEKLLQRFYRYVCWAIAHLNLSEECSVSIHGPAVEVAIQVNEWKVCKVDMVVALRYAWPYCIKTRKDFAFVDHDTAESIQSKGILVVPKHCRRSEIPLWYASFVEAENVLIRQQDPGCRRNSFRIVKALLKGTKLNSYHLKNIWLKECEDFQNPEDWAEENLRYRVLGLLIRVKRAIAHQMIPSYFLPMVNKFNISGHSDLNNMKQRVNFLVFMLRE